MKWETQPGKTGKSNRRTHLRSALGLWDLWEEGGMAVSRTESLFSDPDFRFFRSWRYFLIRTNCPQIDRKGFSPTIRGEKMWISPIFRRRDKSEIYWAVCFAVTPFSLTHMKTKSTTSPTKRHSFLTSATLRQVPSNSLPQHRQNSLALASCLCAAPRLISDSHVREHVCSQQQATTPLGGVAERPKYWWKQEILQKIHDASAMHQNLPTYCQKCGAWWRWIQQPTQSALHLSATPLEYQIQFWLLAPTKLAY